MSIELAKKDAELMAKDTEIAKSDAKITALKCQVNELQQRVMYLTTLLGDFAKVFEQYHHYSNNYCVCSHPPEDETDKRLVRSSETCASCLVRRRILKVG